VSLLKLRKLRAPETLDADDLKREDELTQLAYDLESCGVVSIVDGCVRVPGFHFMPGDSNVGAAADSELAKFTATSRFSPFTKSHQGSGASGPSWGEGSRGHCIGQGTRSSGSSRTCSLRAHGSWTRARRRA